MRDWSSVVRSRLIALGIEVEREEQIRAELAGHLEDVYVDAIRRGCTEDDAAARRPRAALLHPAEQRELMRSWLTGLLAKEGVEIELPELSFEGWDPERRRW